MSAPTVSCVAGELEDCAGLFECYAEWHDALFKAIRAIADQRDVPMTELKSLELGERTTVAQLADIGAYLADQAWGNAKEYAAKAEAMRQTPTA